MFLERNSLLSVPLVTSTNLALTLLVGIPRVRRRSNLDLGGQKQRACTGAPLC